MLVRRPISDWCRASVSAFCCEERNEQLLGRSSFALPPGLRVGLKDVLPEGLLTSAVPPSAFPPGTGVPSGSRPRLWTRRTPSALYSVDAAAPSNQRSVRHRSWGELGEAVGADLGALVSSYESVLLILATDAAKLFRQ